MRQDRAKSYSDSERDGFLHKNNNRNSDEKNKILAKYTAVANEYNTLASNLSSDLKDKYSTIAGTIE